MNKFQSVNKGNYRKSAKCFNINGHCEMWFEIVFGICLNS